MSIEDTNRFMLQSSFDRTVSHRPQGIDAPAAFAFSAGCRRSLYVFCDVLNRLLPCPVTTMMHKLAFECSPEAFHRSIVITIPFSAH